MPQTSAPSLRTRLLQGSLPTHVSAEMACGLLECSRAELDAHEASGFIRREYGSYRSNDIKIYLERLWRDALRPPEKHVTRIVWPGVVS